MTELSAENADLKQNINANELEKREQEENILLLEELFAGNAKESIQQLIEENRRLAAEKGGAMMDDEDIERIKEANTIIKNQKAKARELADKEELVASRQMQLERENIQLRKVMDENDRDFQNLQIELDEAKRGADEADWDYAEEMKNEMIGEMRNLKLRGQKQQSSFDKKINAMRVQMDDAVQEQENCSKRFNQQELACEEKHEQCAADCLEGMEKLKVQKERDIKSAQQKEKAIFENQTGLLRERHREAQGDCFRKANIRENEFEKQTAALRAQYLDAQNEYKKQQEALCDEKINECIASREEILEEKNILFDKYQEVIIHVQHLEERLSMCHFTQDDLREELEACSERAQKCNTELDNQKKDHTACQNERQGIIYEMLDVKMQKDDIQDDYDQIYEKYTREIKEANDKAEEFEGQLAICQRENTGEYQKNQDEYILQLKDELEYKEERYKERVQAYKDRLEEDKNQDEYIFQLRERMANKEDAYKKLSGDYDNDIKEAYDKAEDAETRLANCHRNEISDKKQADYILQLREQAEKRGKIASLWERRAKEKNQQADELVFGQEELQKEIETLNGVIKRQKQREAEYNEQAKKYTDEKERQAEDLLDMIRRQNTKLDTLEKKLAEKEEHLQKLANFDFYKPIPGREYPTM